MRWASTAADAEGQDVATLLTAGLDHTEHRADNPEPIGVADREGEAPAEPSEGAMLPPNRAKDSEGVSMGL